MRWRHLTRKTAKAAAKGEQGEECGRGEKTSDKLAEAYQLQL